MIHNCRIGDWIEAFTIRYEEVRHLGKIVDINDARDTFEVVWHPNRPVKDRSRSCLYKGDYLREGIFRRVSDLEQVVLEL